jgi:general stress protein 26
MNPLAQGQFQTTARELIDQTDAVFLTTLDADGFPLTRAMLNLHNPKLFPGLVPVLAEHARAFEIFFTTNTSSAKVRQLVGQPRAAVYYCLPQSWQGMCLRGKIEIVTEPGLKQAFWQPAWTRYYTQGCADPDYAILRFSPATANYYRQLQTAQWMLDGHGNWQSA